jgi:heme-degrading monooxygenase HmoA
MLAHLAIHTPKPERIDELIASMQRFAAAGRSQAGLQEVHTMRDAESGKLLGLAIWESREAFDQGVQAMRTAVENDPFLEWVSVRANRASPCGRFGKGSRAEPAGPFVHAAPTETIAMHRRRSQTRRAEHAVPPT